MGRNSVTLLKFVGTISLGLLTGLSYTLSTTTLPSLLALPTAPSASRAYHHIKATATRHIRALSTASIASLLGAYILSPPRARHPYLLWTALVAGLGRAGVDYALAARQDAAAAAVEGSRARPRRGRPISMTESDGELGVKSVSSDNGDLLLDEDDDSSASDDGVNGEELRRAMEGFRLVQGVRAGVSGLAFAMGVVGVWGDRGF